VPRWIKASSFKVEKQLLASRFPGNVEISSPGCRATPT
jgi:hypothetical protein